MMISRERSAVAPVNMADLRLISYPRIHSLATQNFLEFIFIANQKRENFTDGCGTSYRRQNLCVW